MRVLPDETSQASIEGQEKYMYALFRQILPNQTQAFARSTLGLTYVLCFSLKFSVS